MEYLFRLYPDLRESWQEFNHPRKEFCDMPETQLVIDENSNDGNIRTIRFTCTVQEATYIWEVKIIRDVHLWRSMGHRERFGRMVNPYSRQQKIMVNQRQ